jgi:hypothetical protein
MSVTLKKSVFSVRCPTRKCTSHFSSLKQLWLTTHFWTCWETGCYPNWIPIITITFYNWTELPAPFLTNVRVLLNRVLPQLWVRCAVNGDNNLLPWSPHSPDLTSCNFFLLGFIKDGIYVLRLPTDMLHWVWDEFDYCVDVCHVTQGAHIEGL